jgi:hypothetical protein
MKKGYLVVYDYGSGGVWAVVWARSPQEINQRYPDLEVLEQHPAWMPEAQYETIRTRMTFDFDEPSGWLAGLRTGSLDQ